MMPTITEDGLWRYNSLPTLCDHAFDYPNIAYHEAGTTRLHAHDRLEPDLVRPGDLVFVKTDLLPVLAAGLDRFPAPFVLVTGVSDQSPWAFEALAHDSRILAWCGTNLPAWSPRVLQLAIGVAERERPHGSAAALAAAAGGLPWNDRAIPVLVTPMAATSLDRAALPPALFHHQEERLSYTDFLALVGRARFVICPPGNGVDTHRVWEALAVGAVPIVLSGPLDPLFADHGCLVVPDWTAVPDRVAAWTDGAAARDRSLAAFRAGDGPWFTRYWASRLRRHRADWLAPAVAASAG
jgi:hypothetical protein